MVGMDEDKRSISTGTGGGAASSRSGMEEAAGVEGSIGTGSASTMGDSSRSGTGVEDSIGTVGAWTAVDASIERG